MRGPISVAEGTPIELLDVGGHKPIQKLVAIGPWWDPHIVGRVNHRELERDQEIFRRKTISFGSRAYLLDRGPLLSRHDDVGRSHQDNSQQLLMRGWKSPPRRLGIHARQTPHFRICRAKCPGKTGLTNGHFKRRQNLRKYLFREYLQGNNCTMPDDFQSCERRRFCCPSPEQIAPQMRRENRRGPLSGPSLFSKT